MPSMTNDLLDARHLHRVGGVVGGELAAHRRAAGRSPHISSRDLGVDAVDGTAGCDVEQIDDLDVALAEIAERPMVLQLDLSAGASASARGCGKRRRSRACDPMGLWTTSWFCACTSPHGRPSAAPRRFRASAASRAAFAHWLNEMAHAARAVGVLVAVFLFVARRLHDP